MSLPVRLLSVLLAVAVMTHAQSVAAQDSKTPDPVSKEVLELINKKVTVQFVNTPPVEALGFVLPMCKIPLLIRQSKTMSEKTASLDLKNVPFAEVLRAIGTKCGCEYRVVKNEIRLAMPDEWKEVDAGRTEFEKIAQPAAKSK